MKNFKLNRTTISILGAFFAPGLLANAGVPANGFGQDANASSEAPKIAAGSQESAKKDEVVDEFGTFEIAVEDVPLPQVLNMLAIQSRRNIITSKRVGSVSITANLFDVTFYEALDSILHKALHPRPEKRYASCQEFAFALEDLLSEQRLVGGVAVGFS